MAYTGTSGFWSDAWDAIKDIKITLPPPTTTFPSNYPTQFPRTYPTTQPAPQPSGFSISPEMILLVGAGLLLLTMPKKRGR